MGRQQACGSDKQRIQKVLTLFPLAVSRSFDPFFHSRLSIWYRANDSLSCIRNPSSGIVLPAGDCPAFPGFGPTGKGAEDDKIDTPVPRAPIFGGIRRNRRNIRIAAH